MLTRHTGGHHYKWGYDTPTLRNYFEHFGPNAGAHNHLQCPFDQDYLINLPNNIPYGEVPELLMGLRWWIIKTHGDELTPKQRAALDLLNRISSSIQLPKPPRLFT